MERAITRDLVSNILEFSMHLIKGINFAAKVDCLKSVFLVCSLSQLSNSSYQSTEKLGAVITKIRSHFIRFSLLKGSRQQFDQDQGGFISDQGVIRLLSFKREVSNLIRV
ncbi:hypothetical protein R6Q59_000105 [Mikania micrantha]